MLFDELISNENDYISKRIENAKTAWFKKENGSFPDSIRLRRPKSETWYYDASVKKDKIVLHYTAGQLAADINQLTTPDYKVSVAYVVARNGKVFELFDPSKWSYHLGQSAIGGNTVNSKTSIGIEISNFGNLKLKDGILYTYTGKEYCTLEQKDAYIKLETPFRGELYYCAYTDAQIESVSKLVDFLVGKFNIPKTFLPEKERYEVFKDKKARNVAPGIYSHVNFVSTKYDIGPAFPWERLMK